MSRWYYGKWQPICKKKKWTKKRKENISKQKSSNWLIVCEGTKTEPNYFVEAVNEINKNIEDKYKLKVNVIGTGKNTVSLVKSVEDLQVEIDKYNNRLIPYSKIFVVFDKDSFSDKNFDEAINMCQTNGYIPLWSNQAIEFWFLLHFNYIDGKMNRKMYATKINEYFKKKGLKYNYHKNDSKIYSKLCTHGSLNKAKTNAKKIHLTHINDKPSQSESCTSVYKFFEAIDERLDELK